MNPINKNSKRNQRNAAHYVFTTLIFFISLLFNIHAASAASATLGWDRNQEPDIAGYKVYWGTESRNYRNSVTIYDSANRPLARSYIINGLEDGKTYYLAITAFDQTGQESNFSEEIIKKTPATSPVSTWDSWYETQNFLEIGHVQITNSWKTVSFPEDKNFLHPVIIAGPPSYNGTDPCIIRIRNVTSKSFEIRIQEWLYLDGQHALEDISFMVIEAGTHVMPDGTIWQAGTYLLKGTLNWQKIDFNEPFEQTPLVFNNSQTFNGNETFTMRMKNSSVNGFSAAIQEEEIKNDGHVNETIGYLAIEPAGELNIQKIMCDHNPVAFGDTSDGPLIFVEEEQSRDSDMQHVDEETGILIINKEIFAHIQTFSGGDTAALRLIW